MPDDKHSVNRQSNWLIAMSVLTLCLCVWVLWAAKDYQHESIEREGYKEGSHFISLLEKSIEQCIKHYQTGSTNSCEEEFGAIEKLASFSDLDAQITVAHGTRGLLFIGAIQAIASIAAVTLLIWTVTQTHSIFQQAEATTRAAREATKAANRTANQSRIATEVELQPYIDMEFLSCEPAIFGRAPWPPDSEVTGQGFLIKIKVINNGCSPALNVVIDFDGKESYITFSNLDTAGKRGYSSPEDVITESYRLLPDRPNKIVSVIPAKGSKDIEFRLACEISADKLSTNPSRPRLFLPTEINSSLLQPAVAMIKDICIRYKDFTSISTRTHKVSKCEINHAYSGAGVADPKNGIMWYEKENDSEHDHYKDYKPSPSEYG